MSCMPDLTGFEVAQTGYLKDVLRRRGIEGYAEAPLPKIEEGQDETPEEVAKHLREAQQLVGELMWISVRTRPDVAYAATGLLGRFLPWRPRYVCHLGEQVMKYLHRTCESRLEYRPQPEKDNCRGLEIYADSSFAPPHEGYRSVQGIMITSHGNPIHWESTRQGFITQSTAEAELLGYLEGFQAGESVSALMTCLEMPEARVLITDNKAALAQCVNESGTWRTRHLRLRAAKLREVLADQDSGWTAEHLKGTSLVADGFTKALQGQAFTKFRSMLMSLEAVEKKFKVQKIQRVKKVCRQEEGAGKARVAAAAGLIAGSLALIACGKSKLGGILAATAAAVHGIGKSLSSAEPASKPRVQVLRGPDAGYHHQEARSSGELAETGQQRAVPPAVARAEVLLRSAAGGGAQEITRPDLRD